MAYDHRIADEIRTGIGPHPALTEREMFGGIVFMINGNMAVGVSGDELMVRVGKEAHDDAVSRPGARPFDTGARPMRGWVGVTREGFSTEEDLLSWVEWGVSFAESLQPK
jgi:TfoX/Sxy family transcriptional regulator of competence genes